MASKTGFCFKRALMLKDLAVIAEIKRRSPSAGNLNVGLDPVDLALKYQRGGAACLSVVTNESLFGGSVTDLQVARQASGLPTLRKDFLTTPEDIYQTKAMGADALLLILADIIPQDLERLHQLARELGLDVLTEIRNRPELEAAVAAGADVIVVNQRSNPKSHQLTVDYGRALSLAKDLNRIAPEAIKVAASGIGVSGGTKVEDLVAAGYDAVLIGEALVTDPDPEAKLQSLLTMI